MTCRTGTTYLGGLFAFRARVEQFKLNSYPEKEID